MVIRRRNITIHGTRNAHTHAHVISKPQWKKNKYKKNVEYGPFKRKLYKLEFNRYTVAHTLTYQGIELWLYYNPISILWVSTSQQTTASVQ